MGGKDDQTVINLIEQLQPGFAFGFQNMESTGFEMTVDKRIVDERSENGNLFTDVRSRFFRPDGSPD